MNIKKILIVIAVIALTLPVGFSASAATNSHSGTNTNKSGKDSFTDIAGLVKNLQEQIKGLQSEQMTLRLDGAVQNAKIARALEKGASGDDVKVLQALLAADVSVYPEGLITGVFGPATEEAVKRFQKKHGLEQAGRVGPKTLEMLQSALDLTPIAFESADNIIEDTYNTIASSTHHGGKKLCARIAPGHLIAPGWLRKNIAPIVPECQKLPPGIIKLLEGRGTTTATTTATTTRDRVAPRIRNIDTEATDSSAEITWTTNEKATSKVYYATTSAVTTSSDSVSSSALTTSHSMTISSLNEDTTYYFFIESRDAANNVATSSVRSFETEN